MDVAEMRKKLRSLAKDLRRQQQSDRRLRQMGISPDQFKPSGVVTMGFVYAVQDISGQIKLGWAKDVNQRVKQLQTGSSQELCLLGYWRGSRKDEANLHSMVRSLHIHNEWYQPDSHLIDYIKEMDESK